LSVKLAKTVSAKSMSILNAQFAVDKFAIRVLKPVQFVTALIAQTIQLRATNANVAYAQVAL